MNGSKMSHQEEIINQLKGKVREIVAGYEKLRLDNDRLTKENKGLNEIVKSKQREIQNFEKKFDTLKVAKTVIMSAEDKHEARLKVNRIVREIDKCIALLNK
jgi:hypothetical protein